MQGHDEPVALIASYKFEQWSICEAHAKNLYTAAAIAALKLNSVILSRRL
jgi:hypothetical protein